MNSSRLAFVAFACLAACSSPPSPDDEANGATGGTGGTSAGGASTVPPPAAGGHGGAIGWPDEKKAAVTLTYDDGLDGQLKHAVPELDARDLKATFFLASFPGIDHTWSLPNATYELTARHLAWREVAENGHELGAHTVHHPCASNGSHFRPTDYSQERMAAELDDSRQRLQRLGATEPLTFAYPCEGDRVGIQNGESYAPLVTARFLAARSSQIGVSGPGAIDLQRVAQKFGDSEGTTGAALIAYVDEAIASGGWAVFTFHGIGPEALACSINEFDLEACALNYLTTDSAAHTALLDYLVARKTDVWTATFKEVAQSLQ